MERLRLPLLSNLSRLSLNGYALGANVIITSALGLVFWALAARFYPAKDVGTGAALISTLTTIGALSQLNLGNALNRFLPQSGLMAGRLILACYGLGAATSVTFAAAFIFAITPAIAPSSLPVTGLQSFAWFAAACVLWAVFALQDSVLSGLRHSPYVMIENTVYAVAKIALLVIFAGSSIGMGGLFVAWTLPLLPIVLVINAFVFRHLLLRGTFEEKVTGTLNTRRLLRFISWDYIGTLATMTALGVSPLLVLRFGGPEANAVYYISWVMAYSVYLLCRSMSTSLLVEGSSDTDRLPALLSEATVHTTLLLLGAAFALGAGAGPIMAIFGTSYISDGPDILRVLVLSCIPWGLITIYLAVARIRERLVHVAVIQAAILVLVVSFGTVLTSRLGGIGMAYSWLIANTTVACGIVIYLLAWNRQDDAASWLLRLASSAARLFAILAHKGAKEPDSAGIPTSFLNDANKEAPLPLQQMSMIRAHNDTVISVLGYTATSSRPGNAAGLTRTPYALLKAAYTPSGIRSLQQSCERLIALREDMKDREVGINLPTIIAVEAGLDSYHVLERYISGEDGRKTLLHKDSVVAGCCAAARAITIIHRRTSQMDTISDKWLSQWIDTPAKSLETLMGTMLTSRRRRTAITNLVAVQRDFWKGKEISLGWSHGDFSPGNILFSSANTDLDRSGRRILVEGIIDWDRARPNAPLSLDLCHLALTVRMLSKGEELGLIVRQLLSAPSWSLQETEWLSGAAELELHHSMSQPEAIRALVGLTWLHHVSSNIEKSRRYENSRLWIASNVDWVLNWFLTAGPAHAHRQERGNNP